METIEELREENTRLKAELRRYRGREEAVAKMRGGGAAWLMRVYMGRDLRKAAETLIEEARSGDRVSSDAVAWTVAAFVHRVVRVGFLTVALAILGGVAGSGLLIWQNVLIAEQTEDSIEVATNARVQVVLERFRDISSVFGAVRQSSNSTEPDPISRVLSSGQLGSREAFEMVKWMADQDETSDLWFTANVLHVAGLSLEWAIEQGWFTKGVTPTGK